MCLISSTARPLGRIVTLNLLSNKTGQCTCNVTLWRVRLTIVAVEKQ
jgi:hypothetical protein